MAWPVALDDREVAVLDRGRIVTINMIGDLKGICRTVRFDDARCWQAPDRFIDIGNQAQADIAGGADGGAGLGSKIGIGKAG